MTTRTRFAPSPTGDLHLGNARTAILNWLVARHAGGVFVLRFEDTDVDRNVEAAEDAILEALGWLGLEADEGPRQGGAAGPYRQSERGELYRAHADRLLREGLAFRCYCTATELEQRRHAAVESGTQPRYDGRCRSLTADDEQALMADGRRPVVRFRVDPGPIVFVDRVRGPITIDGAEFGDMVILRSDGRPTYNFAVVVDDMLMRITHVIRGVGHLANTPKQVLLYRALGAPIPEFAHIPTILAPGGGKLSKREGSPGVLDYRDEGFHPDAVVNYLSLLSWSSESGREVLTREELIGEMDLDRIGSSDAVLDIDKMRWLSGQHMRIEPIGDLARRVRPYLTPALRELPTGDLERALSVVRERVFLLTEAAREVEALLVPPTLDSEARRVLAEPLARSVLVAVAAAWEAVECWTPESVKQAAARAGAELGTAGKQLYQPLRAALTGRLKGPELGEVAFVLGSGEAVHRLRIGAEHASASSGVDTGG